ncbi:MAG: HIT family protein [Clostridiales bacterium]|nr:HIT family protein [Clostridiales bacterium]
MSDCLVCTRIGLTREGKNRYFVRELETGYVVLGDYQRFPGYTLFLCKRHATELHQLDKDFRSRFLMEMATVSEAVWHAFKPDKLNYELLGQGKGVHMHWHIFPRRAGDTPVPGPVWQLGAAGLNDAAFLPDDDTLAGMRDALNRELDRLL